MERYDPRSNTWTYTACMTLALTSPAVAACHGKLYVCGGAVLEDGDGIDHVQVMSGVHLKDETNGSTSEQQILRQLQHSLPKYRQVPQ